MPEDTILSFSPSSSLDLKQPLVCLIPFLLSLSLLALRRILLLLPQAAASGCVRGCPRSGRFESRCTVCLDDILFDEGKFKVLPECGHVFHAECIDRWLKCRPSCPLCQRAVAVAGNNRSFKERVCAAVLLSLCQWMDKRFDSELTLLFCHHL